MRRIILVAAIALSLAGCSGIQKKIELATGVYKTAVTTTVPASAVTPVANSFDILKGAATNYGRYCISKQMTPSICSADIRRNVIRAVRSGTRARDQLETSLETNQPALASIYNILVSAVNGLKSSPAANQTFVDGVQ